MTPAEKRVKELIDRWLTSLDLHLQYVDLNDSAYNNVQPWPVHDRPTRWVLELAKQKALELQAAFDSRLAMGDAKFAESLELMVFLATLVGIQHVQRYIPLADPERHGQGTLTELDGLKPVGVKAAVKPVATVSPVVSAPAAVELTVAVPRAAAPAPIAVTPPRAPAKTPSAPSVSADSDATREMPRPQRAPVSSPPPPAPTSTMVSAAAPSAPKPAPKPDSTATIQALSETHNLVINDAVRLLNWGRPWHELAELIARIADRPKLPEVRRILRSHRAAIEMRVADAKDEKEEKEKAGK